MPTTEDADYWRRFDARLGDLPVTGEAVVARRRLTDAAAASGGMTTSAEDHADLVYRLGIQLGGQVCPETIDGVRRRNREDERRLLAEGVDASLLGRSG